MTEFATAPEVVMLAAFGAPPLLMVTSEDETGTEPGFQVPAVNQIAGNCSLPIGRRGMGRPQETHGQGGSAQQNAMELGVTAEGRSYAW